MLALRRSVFAARSAIAIQAAPRRGLEEFFDRHNTPYQQVHHGRAWDASELRRKSDEDLHKLWYVCLKERNMLLTLQHDAMANKRKMDGEERFKEVKLTMRRIKVVLGERERAIQEYQRQEEAKRVAEVRAGKADRRVQHAKQVAEHKAAKEKAAKEKAAKVQGQGQTQAGPGAEDAA